MKIRFDEGKNISGFSVFKLLFGLSGTTKTILLSIFLFAFVVGTFFPAIENDFMQFDDPLYVTENVHVKQGLTWEGIKWATIAVVAGNWHPLTMLSHMTDCQLFGLKPWGHHLMSVLLHAADTVLLFLLLKRMTGKTGRSFFVAALFGLHPLHVESVAWVAERKDVLSTLFWLLTLLAYVKFVGEFKTQDGTGKSKKFYRFALVFFMLGLMSKPMLVTLPCVLLLLDYWPLKRLNEKNGVQLIMEKWPFFALAAIASVITFAAQKGAGSVVGLMTLPFSFRLENALLSYARYLGKFFYPANLCAFYPHPGWWPPGIILFATVILAVISVFAFWLRRQQPWLLMAWLWFVGTLVPVIGLVQIGQQSMADRYTYIPLIGIFIVVTWGACELTKDLARQSFILSAIAAATILSCAVLTRAQIYWWKDSETFFRHAIAVTENNDLAYNNLGFVLATEGRFGKAIDEYKKALDLRPDDARVRCNLGIALNRQGHPDEAINQYLEAIKDDPNFIGAYDNLIDALNKKGRFDEAMIQFQKALSLNLADPSTYNNMGNLLDKLGRFDEAISDYKQALKLDPDFADAHADLGVTLGHKGLSVEAVRELQAAVKLNPDSEDIRYNLGNALDRAGQLNEAIVQFNAALKLKPGDAETRNNLGTVFYRTKHLDEAIGEFQKALKLKPDYAEARQNLDTALRVKDSLSKQLPPQPVPETAH